MNNTRYALFLLFLSGTTLPLGEGSINGTNTVQNGNKAGRHYHADKIFNIGLVNPSCIS